MISKQILGLPILLSLCQRKFFKKRSEHLKFFSINGRSIAKKASNWIFASWSWRENNFWQLWNMAIWNTRQTLLPIWPKKCLERLEFIRKMKRKSALEELNCLCPLLCKLMLEKFPNTKKIKNFESLWEEGKLKNNSHNGGTQFLNMIYYPNKSLTDDFLGKLSTSIDYATVENNLFSPMGNYNINFPYKKECNCVDTILTPNGLHVLNKTDPNRTEGFSKSFIDYIITDLPNASFFKTYNSDTLLKTKTMTHADRRAISDFSLIGNENN